MRNTIQVTVLCLIFTSLASAFKLMCYVDKASRLRSGAAQFDASKIDANLCTHLVAAFAEVQGNAVVASSGELAFFSTLTALKTSNPGLKVLLAVGGTPAQGSEFSTMAATSGDRSTFIQSAISVMRGNNFDGIVLDWRYTYRSDDKEEFTALCQEMANALDNEPTGSNVRLLLAAAVSGDRARTNQGYDVAALDTCLDLIHIMAHDFYSVPAGVTRHHAPLYRGTLDTAWYQYWNAEYAMMLWKNRGATPSKVLMGMTTYGRSYTLASHPTALGSAITGPGAAGPHTNRPGSLSYYEVCSGGFTRVWSDSHEVPYGYSGNQWVGYDDQESIGKKATFVINHGFGGGAVFSLDQDDFGDMCDDGNYPLVSQLYDYLEAGIPSINFTSAEESGNTCPLEGFQGGCFGRENSQYSVPGYPRCYYNCWDERAYLQSCPEGMYFEEEGTSCEMNADSLSNNSDGSEGGINNNYCRGKTNSYHVVQGDRRFFYQCVHGTTHVHQCPGGLVFDMGCLCCNWP